MASPYHRTLPARPDLDQQKAQAKELLQAFVGGDPEAIARVRTDLPDKASVVLADAQFVLAREYGFANWAALRAHIESVRADDESVRWQWHTAVGRRDARATRRLLEQHASVRAHINDPAFAFDAPALVATSSDAAMVEVLLEFGADPNRRSEWWAGGFHALYGATSASAERLVAAGAVIDACAAAHLDRGDVLARLIAENPACVHERGGDGQTPLHFARSRDMVDRLLAHGADIDARDVDHRATPAEWMLDRFRGRGRYELARYLVERGASVDIFLAAALGLTERVKTLVALNPAALDLRIGQGQYAEQPPSSYHIYFWTIGGGCSPIEVAVQFGHHATAQAMLAFASPLQRLQVACARGDEHAAHAIAREHPGLVASMGPADHLPLPNAAWHGNARAVALMLDLGFDPRTPGHDSGTALHCAAWEGSSEIVGLLLRHSAAAELVTIRDAHYGATALGWCCHGSVNGNRSHDHAGVARLLVAAGAPLGQDTSGGSPPVEAVLAAARRAAGA